MGFGDWLSNAASNVGGAIAAPFKAETWQAVGNGIASAASTVKDVTVKAATWTYDKAIAPVGNAIAVTAKAATGDAEAQKQFGQAMSATGNAIASFGKGALDYGKFAVTNPQMFLRQAGQGLSDSVTGLGGFVADVVVYAGEGVVKGVANVGLGVANLGSAPGERLYDYYGMSKFSKTQDWLEEKTGSWLGFSRAELDELAATGEIRRDTGRVDAKGEPIFEAVYKDSNFTAQEASFAAGTKYATRAIGEVGTFVAVSAVTAGAGGVALASLRGGNLGLKAAQAGNFLARGGRLGEMAAQPLYWLGRDVAVTRGLTYLDDAAKLRAAIAAGEKVPEIGLVGRFARLPGVRVTEPVLKFYDPGQTASAFANLASRTTSGSAGYGLRAAEGTFNFLNPIAVNGNLFPRQLFSRDFFQVIRSSEWRKAAFAWSLEGGGAALSYHSNSSKEGKLADMAAGLRQQDQQSGEALGDDLLRRHGIDPNAPAGANGGVPAAPNGAAAPTDAPPANITPGFQDSAQKDTEVTHQFNINNGMVQQPTDLTLPVPGQVGQPAAPAPTVNNNRPR